MILKIRWSLDPENLTPNPCRGGPMTLKIRWSLEGEKLAAQVVP
jgi:hypothetical protein